MSMVARGWLRGIWGMSLAVGVVTGAAGCNDTRCDPGQEFRNGECVQAAADAGVDDAAAADDAAGADAATAPEDAAAGSDAVSVPLGTTCLEDADCGGETNFCARQPGTPSGYCSIKGCTVSPNDCPEGYTCVDMSQYAPGLIFCMQP